MTEKRYLSIENRLCGRKRLLQKWAGRAILEKRGEKGMDEKVLLDEIGKMIAPIAERQMHMQTMMEDMGKRIDLLFEGQGGMNEKFAKLDTVAEDVEEIKLTVRAMEAVTQRNSNDIQKLRAVK